jgi:ankyrin repeat protein
MDALLSLGANINACYHGLDASSTPLALTAYFGEPQIAKYLISHGADGTLLDSMKRNTLHGITKYFPDRHGYLPHYWHYWIRHGSWEQHSTQMTNLVHVLIKAGADINAKDKGYSPLTPIAAAADLGVWDGGMICALLDAGANLEESILSAGDTVLHCWVSIVGPRLDYPESYLPTMQKIAKAMPNIDIRNRFQEDTPLHLLATTYHPEDEFEAACEILLNHSNPADINAKARRGETPLSIALETNLDPARRGRFLLDKGADPLVLHARERDIFYSIANNVVLNDQASSDLIQTFLLRLNADIEQAYKTHYLCNANSHETLNAAASRGKTSTVKLLLSIGLLSHINKPDTAKSPPWTALDQALHFAELSRRAHIQQLASYKAGTARTNALEADLVYDINQGPPARAAEAYRCFPDVIQTLRNAGAKRTCEIDRLSNGDYIRQPREWDEEEIRRFGFTPETQPNREAWKELYDLARYSGRGWLGMLTGGRFGS